MSDLIRRDDAIDAIGADIDEIDAFDPSAGIMKACIRRAIWKVMGVPSADRPQGEWFKDDEGTFICSACGSGYKDQPTLMGKPMFKWCPLCGARMKGADDDMH